MNKIENAILNDQTFLVKKIQNYFAKARAEGSNFEVDKFTEYYAGEIVNVSEDLKKDFSKYIGNIIYYRKDLDPVINIKGLGLHSLVKNASRLLIRDDQTAKNY